MKKTMLCSVALSLGLAAGMPALAQTKEIKFGCYAPHDRPACHLRQEHAVRLRHGDRRFPEVDRNPRGSSSRSSARTIRAAPTTASTSPASSIENPGHPAVLGSWSSTVTLAAGPLYNQAKLVNITPISSHPDVTKVGPYVFRQSLVQIQEGAANGRHLWKLGAKQHRDARHPERLRQGQHGASPGRLREAQGGKVVFEEFVRPDAQDFRQTLQKAQRENPDWIYIGAFAPQTALMLKQIRQMGIKTPVYVCGCRRHARPGPSCRH